jgi:FMN reductase
MWSVDEDPLPFYQPQEPLGPVAERFLKLVRGADAYIWSTPAYHGSISAPVKNLLDYIDAFRHDQPPFLAGKVVGVAAVGDGSIAAVQAAGALVQIAHALQAVVVPMQVPVCYVPDVMSDGRITDQKIKARLGELGRLVVATARRLRPTAPERGVTLRQEVVCLDRIPVRHGPTTGRSGHVPSPIRQEEER